MQSGASNVERYELVNVETDRVTNSLNTLSVELVQWERAAAVYPFCGCSQNTRRFKRSSVNLAVSATTITAITPACTGSVTTRSAASGTLPAIFRLITTNPCCAHLAHRGLDVAAHQRTGQHQRLGARQPRHRAHRVGQFLLAHQRNRVHRDVFAANVVPVRLAHGADRHLPHLRAAAHDDDALAVDRLQRLDHLHARAQSAGRADRPSGPRAPPGSTTSKYVRASAGRLSRISTEVMSP